MPPTVITRHGFDGGCSVSAQPNERVNLPVRPVTPLAGLAARRPAASAADATAGYAQRWVELIDRGESHEDKSRFVD